MCGHHLSSMNPDFPTFAAIAIETPPTIICIPSYRSSGTAIPKLYAGWVGEWGGMIADCTRRCPGAPVSTICAAAVQQQRWRNALAAPGLKGCHFVHMDSTGIIVDVHWILPAFHLNGQAQSFVTDALRYTHYIIIWATFFPFERKENIERNENYAGRAGMIHLWRAESLLNFI